MNRGKPSGRLAPRVGVGALCSPMEVGADRAPRVAAALARLLEGQGAEVVRLGTLDTPEAAAAAGQRLAGAQGSAVVLGAASWFEDYLVLDLLEECPVPVLLWALPGMETGALCGTQQVTCYLKQLDRPYFTVFGEVAEGAEARRAWAFVQAAALRARLRRARIGLAGTRVRGMTEVSAPEIALKKVLGPRIVPVDLAGLLAAAGRQPSRAVQAVWDRVFRKAARVTARRRDGLLAAGFYLALAEIIRREGLSALAFGCYPDYMGRACLAASLLADQGLPISCEGDVNGAVGMLMLALLTGQPTHNTDWLDPLPDGTVVFTHCGSGSHRLADTPPAIHLAPVRLAHQGVCSLFTARPGPVTLVSLLPTGDRYQMAVLEGEAVRTDMVFPGNPLRVRFEAPVGRLIEWIHDEGIGHHWMAGYGHVGASLEHLARMIGPGLRCLAGPPRPTPPGP